MLPAKMSTSSCDHYIKHMSQALATSLTTEGSEFESRWVQEFSLLHVVQTGSGDHPTSFSKSTRGFFLGGKAAGA
jgi:hypothetical protein